MKVSWFTGLAIALASATATAQNVSQFAHTGRLVLQGQGALYEAPLTADAYGALMRRDLGDVRVYNGNGERVPYALVRPRESEQEPMEAMRVPYFPVQAGHGRQAGNLVLHADRHGEGSISATVTMHEMGERGSSVAGYIVDLSDLETAIAGVRLVWDSAPSGTNVRADVFASDDLSVWRTLVLGAPLLQLRQGDATLLRDRIEFPATKAKYLRLTWQGQQPPLGLRRVDVQPVGAVTESRREWVRFVAGPSKQAGEYVYEVGEALPIDRISIELPQPNAIAPATLHVWDDGLKDWRLVSSFVAYRLGEGDREVMSPDVKIYATGRRWMLKLDTRAGDLGTGAPILQAGWIPHRLIFNARGDGPFTVAFGNPQVEPAALSAETLVPGYGTDRASPVAGAEMRSVQPNPQHATGWFATMNTKQVMLWATLIGAVALIAFIAWRLMRQMSKGGTVKGAQR